MKKRIMSLLLTASMLLCSFTVFGATPSAAAQGEAAKAGNTVSYVDLYVKDGLVALFDGYSVNASDLSPTEWAPEDLFGKEGYDSYVDPSLYSYALKSKGNRFAWAQVDGGYALQRKQAVGVWDSALYLDLDSLGAILGNDGIVTVQEVVAHAAQSPVLEGNTVKNYSSLPKNYDYYPGLCGSIGPLLYGGTQMTGINLAGTHKVVGVVIEQWNFNESKGNTSKYLGHLVYRTADYGVTLANGIKGNDGEDLTGYYIGASTVIERTVTRHTVTEAVRDGVTEYTSRYTLGFVFTPAARGGYPLSTSGFSYTSSDSTPHFSTALRVAADGALTHSVRIYDRELSSLEISRNHVADLAAFYELDSAAIAKILTFDKFQNKALYGYTDAMKLTAEKNGVAYEKAKEAFKTAVAEAEAEAPEAPAAYVDLYVKDGLIALFDAYSEVASDKAVTQWKPEALAGVSGYDAYIDTTTYSYPLVGSWHWTDGGLTPENADTPYLNLNSLGALLGTTYTVQEVMTYPLLTPVIENGVFVNSEDYEVFGDYNTGAVGGFLYGALNHKNLTTDKTGYSKHVHNVLIEQYCFGTLSSYNYLTHIYYVTPAYGAVEYPSLKDAQGKDYSGYLIGGGDTLIERSIARLGITETVEEGVKKYTSLYKTHHQLAPYYRTPGAVTDAEFVVTRKSEDRDVHYSTTLRLAGGDATYHAIRIYDRELTAAEYNRNHLVDLLAYSGTSLERYSGLSPEMKTLIADLMASVALTKDSDLVADTMERYIALVSGDVDVSKTLYVTDGLTVLLSAYRGLSTAYEASGSGEVIWSNAVDANTFATLHGTGWTKTDRGGFRLIRTLENYTGKDPADLLPGEYGWWLPREDYGLEMDGALIPEDDYTVELVANPVGITNEDGTRFIDSYSKYGTFIENGFAIGPLRAFQYACYRPVGNEGQLERRWVYGKGDTPFADNDSKGLVNETHWQSLGIDEVVTLTITLQKMPEMHSYSIMQNGRAKLLDITKDKVLSNEEADGMFRLMYGVAGTIFSVRVYDRVLSDDEMAQNRMADLIYHYDLDAGLLEDIIKQGSSIASLSKAFADFDFTMDQDEARELFSQRLVAVWLSDGGYAIRKDMTDGIRYYFDVNEAAINAATKVGFTVEIGTLVNVDKQAWPVLDGRGYDYRIVAYDAEMGKEKALFVDEDTYAVTVRYRNAQKAELTAPVHVIGYVKLTDADGTETVYYTTPEKYTPKSMFESYYLTNEDKNSPAQGETDLLNYIAKRMDDCYDDRYIYLDAAAANGGNGTESAPYNDFATAFAASKEFLRGVTSPTNLFLTLADGRYHITETQQMLEEDKPYEYASFTVISESGNAVLTSTVDMDAGKFTSLGDNIYSYQFEADKDGKFPAFRTLYVNDGLAEIATSGSSHATERENLYITAFDRTFNGIYYTAKTLRGVEGYDFTYVPSTYIGREDLIEEFVYYRDKYIALNDLEALVKREDAELYYGMDPVHKNGSDAYKQAFEQLLLQFMGSFDVSAIAKNITVIAGNTYFRDLMPTKTAADFGGSEELFKIYERSFILARNAIYAANDNTYFYNNFDIPQEGDVRSVGKLYMPEGMVGDLTSLIEPGKAYMKEYAASLLESASTTADLKTAQELSAAVNDEYLWRRHCLTPYKIELHHTCQWNYNIVHLSGVDYNDYVEVETAAGKEKHVAVYIDMNEYRYFQINTGYSTAKRYVHMKNVYSYLDENNEYFYDEKAGKLYYYSSAPVSEMTVGYATLDNLFIFKDVEHVTFRGVQFTGLDDYYLSKNGYMGGQAGMQRAYTGIYGTKNAFQDRGALYFEDCSDVTVSTCRFYDLPCEAIDATGWSENYVIEDNSFENIGSAAIRIGTHKLHVDDGVDSTWIEGVGGSRNVTVTNNYFANIATEYYVPVLMITKADGATISHNTIIGCSFAAISVGWDWDTNLPQYDHSERINLRNVDISYNYITDFMTEMGDGGAIYTPIWNGERTNTDFYMNAIHHNTVLFSEKTGDGLGNMVVGIYFDAYTSNWYCYENVIIEQSYGAADGEDDYADFGMTDEEIALKRLRRKGSTYIYVQYIDGQETHNILIQGNYILNVRYEEEDAQHYEVFKETLSVKNPGGRNLVEEDTRCIVGLRNIPSEALDVVVASGATGHEGDINVIYTNNY